MIKYILGSILLIFSLAANAAGESPAERSQREPLPQAQEPHFVAVVACGSVKLFLYYDAENMLVIQPGQIKSREDMEALLDLKEAAQDEGNAKVVRVVPNNEECKRT